MILPEIFGDGPCRQVAVHLFDTKLYIRKTRAEDWAVSKHPTCFTCPSVLGFWRCGAAYVDVGT